MSSSRYTFTFAFLFFIQCRCAEIEEGEPEWEAGGYLTIVCWSAAILLVTMIGSILHRLHVSVIPESLVTVGIGALLGLLGRAVTDIHWTDSIDREGILNAAVLNLALLPIIIFESGWSCRTQDFMAELGYILLFAVLGTIIAMFVTAGLIFATGQFHGLTDFHTILTFSILITAVDPVATLATYSHLNVDPLLNILVFGEAIINDAVAIAIFRTLNVSTTDLSASTAGTICLEILKLFFGSLGLGVALGGVYILILRCAQMKSAPVLEILFIFTSCFFTFAFAEHICGMSGIITVLFCGMMLRAYATPHLTVEGRLLASFLLKQAASLADMVVFLFVGVALVYINQIGLLFGLALMGFCIVSRIIAVVPLGLMTNCAKDCFGKSLPEDRKHTLNWKHMFMMCHAGLRGGIALVLVLELGSWVDDGGGGATREMLRNSTLVVILGFLILCGGSTELTLKLLGVRMGSDVDSNELLYQDHHHSHLFRGLHWLNKRVVVPLLVGRHKREIYMQGSIMSKILECADEPRRAPSGVQLPGVHMSSQVLTSAERSYMFGLFGNNDPAGGAGVESRGVMSDLSDLDDASSEENTDSA
eukprot:TRINITY_DN35542_c0_g1_i1.p1 TRINITY_DN35542_c0_g1~~TRINITY_DN35542_c0_g1_i1.p1  ORF type:complete len:591 (-),score=71.15 TRINITY_DN35542_c0_g1_i1:270-2042(-)